MEKPAAPGQLRIAAHTDYGTITILRADNCPGKSLQVIPSSKYDTCELISLGWIIDVVFRGGIMALLPFSSK
jgi:hypothetical protein